MLREKIINQIHSEVRMWRARHTSGSRSRFQKILRAVWHRLSSRRVVRYSLFAGNLVVLGVIGYVVFGTTTPGAKVSRSGLSQASAAADVAAGNPLDQPSSADIALNLARMTSLPETPAVSNQADSSKIELSYSAAGTVVVAKPQAVATALKSKKDIQVYTAIAGDSIASVAAKFNVTSDSIRWSNGLSGDALTVGRQLWIPPVTGIVYVVASGDTPDSLAQKYKITKDQIVAYNDAEIDGLKVGERIILPDAQQPAVRAAYSSYSSIGFAFGTSAIYGFNGYIPGWCTWYVASRISVPTNWGNANTWDNGARASGWTVSPVPVKGAIAQTDRGSQGHVAIVDEVSADGSQIKYSDMNGIAGFNHIGYSDWVPVSHFPNYIYH